MATDFKYIIPDGVIGSISDFGSDDLGSSPNQGAGGNCVNIS